MFRETVGEYKFNGYMNRKDYRVLIRAIKKEKKSKLDQLQINWLERRSKNV